MRVSGIRVGGSRVAAERVTGTVVDIPEVSDPLAALNDDFDGAEIDAAWDLYKPASVVLSQSGGNLTAAIVAGGIGDGTNGSHWWTVRDGWLLTKPVTGDFRCILDLTVTNEAGNAVPPYAVNQWRFGGLAAHDPDRATVFNYVHCGIGTGSEFADTLLAEWKNCTDSVSPYGGVTIDYNSGQLMMEREGQEFRLYVREASADPWTEIDTIDRSAAPLPATLDVGMMCYDADADDDVRAQFHRIRFETL